MGSLAASRWITVLVTSVLVSRERLEGFRLVIRVATQCLVNLWKRTFWVTHVLWIGNETVFAAKLLTLPTGLLRQETWGVDAAVAGFGVCDVVTLRWSLSSELVWFCMGFGRSAHPRGVPIALQHLVRYSENMGNANNQRRFLCYRKLEVGLQS